MGVRRPLTRACSSGSPGRSHWRSSNRSWVASSKLRLLNPSSSRLVHVGDSARAFASVLSKPRAFRVFAGLGSSGIVVARCGCLTDGPQSQSVHTVDGAVVTGVPMHVVVWADGPRQVANDLIFRVPRGDADAAVLHLRGPHPRRLRQLRLVRLLRVRGSGCLRGVRCASNSSRSTLCCLP